MPILIVRYTATSGRAASAALAQFRQRLAGDLSPLPEQIGADLAESQKSNILESRSPSGAPYAPLKRVTEGKSPRPEGHGQDPRPLIDRGEAGGFLSTFGARAGSRSVFAGHGSIVGSWHDQGKVPNVPQRKVVGLRPEDRGQILSRVREHITNVARSVVSPTAGVR